MARLITVPPHYIRANEANRVPSRWIYLDTEAHDELVGRVRTQTWRLGVTCFERRDSRSKSWAEPEWRTHKDPGDLWRYVDSKTKERARTIVMAHNISYDLRIAQALETLPQMGWEIDQFGITGRTVTMTWKKAKRTLVMVDSMSWWPMGLAKIGKMVGVVKPRLPDWEDTDDAWEIRCHADVEILRTANHATLDWIENSALGNWQKTGAGMAWANWRHAHYSHRVLVHAEEDARTAECAAIGTGRCEAWRHGQITNGLVTEWDLPLAYPRIASECRVPTRLQGNVSGPTLGWLSRLPTYRRAIVRATVTLDQPTLAVRNDNRWVWPVGTFTGWWWDSEIEMASETAVHMELHEAWTYSAALALKDWADWVMAVCTDQTGTFTPLQQATAKHWARALIGRFGAKYPLWVEYGQAGHDQLTMGDLYDTATASEGRYMTMGGKFFTALEESYVADACPAIMGAIMAECRVRLWRLAQVAGTDHVLYMDTDSLYTDRIGSERLARHTKEGDGWGLRVKRRHRSIEILGPRQLIIEGQARISGVPTASKRVGGHEYLGERWEGIEQAVRLGRPDQVKIRETTWQITPTDHRRRHLAGGATEPFSIDQARMAREATQTA